jgi:hypothetical protein
MMKRRPSGSFIFSLAIHTALLVVLANVVLHYDIVFAPPVRPAPPVAEHVSYVVISPPAGAIGGTTATPPAKATQPSRRLVAPVQTPAAVPQPSRVPPVGGTQGGVAGGTGVGGGHGATTGIVPADPDPRLVTDSKFFYPAYKTPGQRMDSAVKATIYAYNDSIARAYANAGKQPGDWTFDRNGKKWGIDGNKIYLGKFAIPSAVLAALPIHIQGNPGEGLSDRLAPSRRADLMLHAQSQFHDDEFKTAVKRIRERKDKERREREKQNEGGGVAQSTSGSR